MKEWMELSELSKFERYAHNFRYKYAKKILKNKVLDIGCGSGIMLKNRNWFGIDVDKNSIFVAKGRGNARFGSIFNIPFKNNNFNGVCCLEVIEHVKNKSKAAKEIHRVLKKGGLVVISTPNPCFLNLAKKFGWGDKFHKKDAYIDRKNLKELFRKNGFELIKEDFQLWVPNQLTMLFPLSNILGNLMPRLSYIMVLVFKKL